MAEEPNLDVAIIGAGPAGLAAALALRQQGIERIMVLERETEAGGVPRHCGHPPFGWREYRRILTGPAYSRRLVAEAEHMGIAIRTRTTVTALGPEGILSVATPHGLETMTARRVVLAMGAREMSRSALLLPGSRPLGVLNTGALQAMVYLENTIPFRRPVILGTELVAFSALLTCMKAGIRPVAMIEPQSRSLAHPVCNLFARLRGLTLYHSAHIEVIEGRTRVETVRIRDAAGSIRLIACDGVLITGHFVPEAALVRTSHLAFDPATGGPVIDAYGRCSDAAYFAVGNVLRPIETSGWCWSEGRVVGKAVADDLIGPRADNRPSVPIEAMAPIRFVVPQRVALPRGSGSLGTLQIRVERPLTGRLRVLGDGAPLWERRAKLLPERRITIPIEAIDLSRPPRALTVVFEEDATPPPAGG